MLSLRVQALGTRVVGFRFRGFGGRGLFVVQGFTVWDRNLKETDASCVIINLLIPLRFLVTPGPRKMTLNL